MEEFHGRGLSEASHLQRLQLVMKNKGTQQSIYVLTEIAYFEAHFL